MTPPPDFIDARILAWAERDPDRPALADPETETPVRYGDLAFRIGAVSETLRDAGLSKDAPVPILAGNGVDLVVAILAVMRAGGIAAPISDPTRYPPPESGVSLAAPAHRGDGEFRRVDGLDALALAVDRPVQSDMAERRPDDIAYVLHTSGSTGPAKRIRMRHDALASWSESVSRQLRLDADPVHCVPLPLAHSYPLWQALSVLAAGCLCCVADGLSRPRGLFDMLGRFPVDAFCATPSLLRLLLGRYGELFEPTARGLRSVFSNSEVMSPGLASACLSAAPDARLVLFYGLSEAPRTAAKILDAGTLVAWDGDVGAPFDGAVVFAKEDGELVIDGPHLAVDCERPHATGDVGRLDRDGNVTVLGRRETVIRTDGAVFTPEAVETYLMDDTDLLDAAAAALPDGRGFVVLAVPSKGMETGALGRGIVDHLPAEMRPEGVVAVRRIPRLPNGNVDRAALADMARDAPDIAWTKGRR